MQVLPTEERHSQKASKSGCCDNDEEWTGICKRLKRMKFIGVIYATREGHTAKIAARIASGLHARGFTAGLFDVKEEGPVIDLQRCDAVVIAASVHLGKHEKEMVDFVREHASRLGTIPSAFISVTLSEAGVERQNATPEERAAFAADVKYVIDRFLKETGWHPKLIKPVAGAILYTKYNFLVRFVMKRIAKKSGGDTDTSRDFDYTDWASLDEFVKELAAQFERSVPA
jgi:menaquinone-dependent protoporphyrinogen oxidase